MKRKIALSVAAISVALSASPVLADDLSFATGNSLKGMCEGTGDDDIETAIKLSLCQGYIKGSFEAVWSFAVMAGKLENCEIEMTAVTNDQITDIVKIYIQNNPSERHKPAFMMVFGSLKQAFPACFGKD